MLGVLGALKVQGRLTGWKVAVNGPGVSAMRSAHILVGFE